MVIVSYPLSVVIVLIAAPFFGGTMTTEAVLWGLGSGVAVGLAVWWFYLALASGPMSVVSPLTAILVAGVPVLIGIAIGERPSLLAYVGIVLALLAVLLVSKESPDATTEEITGGRKLRFTKLVAWLTVGSGLAFAFGFVFLHQIPEGTGLWPVLVSRAMATLVVWGVALSTKQFKAPRGEPLRLAIYVSFLDVIATSATMFAFQGGLLSLVSVVASLYPAATVLLAMVMLGERVGRLQQIGMVLALGAVGLIAAA